MLAVTDSPGGEPAGGSCGALAPPAEPPDPAVDPEVLAAKDAYAQQKAAFERYLDRIGAPEQLPPKPRAQRGPSRAGRGPWHVPRPRSR